MSKHTTTADLLQDILNAKAAITNFELGHYLEIVKVAKEKPEHSICIYDGQHCEVSVINDKSKQFQDLEGRPEGSFFGIVVLLKREDGTTLTELLGSPEVKLETVTPVDILSLLNEFHKRSDFKNSIDTLLGAGNEGRA